MPTRPEATHVLLLLLLLHPFNGLVCLPVCVIVCVFVRDHIFGTTRPI